MHLPPLTSVASFENVAAVALAGGLGTRIRHLLPDMPKPMAPVAGRPFLEWVIRFLAQQGIRQVVVSTGYLAEVVAAHFQSGPISGVTVQCVPEPSPLGTAGGFLHAARASGWKPAAWLVLNGDSLVFTDLKPLALELQTPGVLGAILGLPVDDATRYGTLALDGKKRLRGFAEKQPGQGVISAGVYLLKNEALGAFPQGQVLSFEKDVFPNWVNSGQTIQVLPVQAPFLDIGTEQSFAQAEGFIRAHQTHFSE